MDAFDDECVPTSHNFSRVLLVTKNTSSPASFSNRVSDGSINGPAPCAGYITGRALCARLGISRRTLLRRLAESPHIHPLRPGRDLIFSPTDMKALEEAL